MAEKGKPAGKPAAGGAKGAAAKGASKGVYKLYTTQGGKLQRSNSTCPKCGPGVFMAKHKDRVTCGHCHYTEFMSKKN